MKKIDIDHIKNNCRYLKIDLPFRGEEDELYNYRRPFDELLEPEDEEANNSAPTSNMLIYTTADGKHSVEVNLQNETLWLSLDEIATLFDRNKSTISRHIKIIFESGELEPDSTVANFATVQREGTRNIERTIVYYNLDMIISIGYRVNSLRGTHFRMWATAVLREYIAKGFAMDD